MTSAAPSGWRAGSRGGDATLSQTPPSQPTEVGDLKMAAFIKGPNQGLDYHVLLRATVDFRS